MMNIIRGTVIRHLNQRLLTPSSLVGCYRQQHRQYQSDSSEKFRQALPYALTIGGLTGAMVIYHKMNDDDFASELSPAKTSNDKVTRAKPVDTKAKLLDPVTDAPLLFDESKSARFPSFVPYLIVGAGTAGFSAARAIRASDSMAKVLIVGGDLTTGEGPLLDSQDTGPSYPPPYMKPPLSKELWRRKQDRQVKMLRPDGDMMRHSWMYYEPESYFLQADQLDRTNYGGVALHRGDPVVKLDPDARMATLKSGHQITYGKCLLATGAHPKPLPAAERCTKTGLDLVQSGLVSYFRSIHDFSRLQKLAKDFNKEGGNLLVIGGGFLGSELASSLVTFAKKNAEELSLEEAKLCVSHIFHESAPMGHVLPSNLAAFVARFEEQNNVNIMPGSDLVSIEQVDRENGNPRLKVRVRKTHLNGTSSLEEVVVDHVVCAVGVEPCVDLAEEANLELDQNHGGFLVNAEMESRAGVFVAGDAASYWDPVLSCRRRVEHLNFAEETGMLAGKNMAASLNGDKLDDVNSRLTSKYQFQSSQWSSLGPGVSWDAVGHLDSRNLETYAFFTEQADFTAEQQDSMGSGVVFYVTPRERHLVGILLWNLTDEIYEEEEHTAPARLNIARSLLQKKLRFKKDNVQAQLKSFARDFDIYGTIAKDYSEFKQLLEQTDSNSEAAEPGQHTDTSDKPAPSSSPATKHGFIPEKTPI